MTKIKLAVLTLAVAIATGCSTVDSTTGQRVHDPVKTAQVRAAIKPIVSAAVLTVVTKNPEAAQYFDQAASAICEMRDTKQVTIETFRARLLGIIDQHAQGVDPLIRLGFITVISVFEINYADRLRADLPPEEFTWNLFDVLCDGVRGGIQTAGAKTSEQQMVRCEFTGLWSPGASTLGR